MNTGAFGRCLALILAGLLVGLPAGPPVAAQAPVAGEGPPPAALSAPQLEELVGRIALYPDDLLAIILPASTYPLDVVQAERFLQKLKQDPKLQPDQRWDESIRSLLNYPEVVSMMSQDLDWTQDLGEAVVSQQADVLKAIQAFRAKAHRPPRSRPRNWRSWSGGSPCTRTISWRSSSRRPRSPWTSSRRSGSSRR